MKTNVYNMVTSRILEQLEQGIIPWHKLGQVQPEHGAEALGELTACLISG